MTLPIIDHYERSTQRPGARVSRRWWEKDGLYLEGDNKISAAAAESDGEETIGKEEGMPLEKTTGRE